MKRSLRLLLSGISGVLLSLPWLGFPGFILFVALLPLLVLNRFFVENKNNFLSVSFLGHTFLTFFIWNICTTWWIMHATWGGAVMAIVTNSFLMSLVWWLGHIACRQFKSNLGYISLLVFWISFEYLHLHWDIEWPWLQLGNGFANTIKIVQWYEYTGVFGGTLWVLLMNVLLFSLLKRFQEKTSIRKRFFAFLLVTICWLIPVGISLNMYASYKEIQNPRNITIVQPNIDPYSEDYDMKAEAKKKNSFLRLAAKVSNRNTNLVIGPETLLENKWYWNESSLKSNPFLNQMRTSMKDIGNAELLFGVSSFRIYPDKEQATQTARIHDGIVYDRFNTALFTGHEKEIQIYHKSKLVAGVEKMPFLKYLGFLSDFVIDIGGTTGSLGRQKEASNFVASDGTIVAPVICYESVFGQYVTEFVKKGAQIIVVITNDGWWKNTPGYKQHLSFSRLRAIETRRSIARAANTGISCFINQRGEILQATSWWEEASINGELNVNSEITFYSKHGDYIARISLFLSVMLCLLFVVERYKQDKKNPH